MFISLFLYTLGVLFTFQLNFQCNKIRSVFQRLMFWSIVIICHFFHFIRHFVIDIVFCNIVESITIQEKRFAIWSWWKILNRLKRYSRWFDDFYSVRKTRTLLSFRTLTIWPWHSFRNHIFKTKVAGNWQETFLNFDK